MFVKGNLTVCLFEWSHHPSTWMGSRGCWNARVIDYVYIYIHTAHATPHSLSKHIPRYAALKMNFTCY